MNANGLGGGVGGPGSLVNASGSKNNKNNTNDPEYRLDFVVSRR